MNITATKRAEENLHNAQAELAHITRLTTLGELTASIADEVNQPLAAVIANAEACLGWINRESPDLSAARRSVEWVIDDGIRASEVVRRVRALATRLIQRGFRSMSMMWSRRSRPWSSAS
jgi:C4-dicarboxylate-specific signal transduction histidine kinase